MDIHNFLFCVVGYVCSLWGYSVYGSYSIKLVGGSFMTFICEGVYICECVVGVIRVIRYIGCLGWLDVWVVGGCHSIHTFD